MAKLTGALAIALFVAAAAAATIVSSAHGARTLETRTTGEERVAIPASTFVASQPAVDDVDFDISPQEEAAAPADGPAAAGPDAWDWDDKTPVSGP
jgi:hypothetical protein